MDYRHIVHLATAVRSGSLTAAAGALGISQPALSKSISAFERALGVPLLERGRFGVQATRYGEAVIARGSVIEAEIRGVAEEIAALRRVGACPRHHRLRPVGGHPAAAADPGSHEPQPSRSSGSPSSTG